MPKESKCYICGDPVVVDYCVGDLRNTGIVSRDGKVWCWKCDHEEDIKAACEANERFNAEMVEEERLADTYPLITRLETHRDERLFLDRFMDWATRHKGLSLWHVVGPENPNGPQEVLAAPATDRLFLEFLNIDSTALDNERRAMMDEMVSAQK